MIKNVKICNMARNVPDRCSSKVQRMAHSWLILKTLLYLGYSGVDILNHFRSDRCAPAGDQIRDFQNIDYLSIVVRKRTAYI